MKKYRLTNETKTFFGRTLHRIECIEAFADIEAGENGGWVEKESNLSQIGNAWVYGDAQVYGNAWVSGDYDYLLIGPIGSRNAYTTFFCDAYGKIIVSCGCFSGDLEQFTAKVAETHGDNQHGRAYKAAIEYVKTVMYGGDKQ